MSPTPGLCSISPVNSRAPPAMPAGPREAEALAALLKQLLNAEPGHRATIR